MCIQNIKYASEIEPGPCKHVKTMYQIISYTEYFPTHGSQL